MSYNFALQNIFLRANGQFNTFSLVSDGFKLLFEQTNKNKAKQKTNKKTYKRQKTKKQKTKTNKKQTR